MSRNWQLRSTLANFGQLISCSTEPDAPLVPQLLGHLPAGRQDVEALVPLGPEEVSATLQETAGAPASQDIDTVWLASAAAGMDIFLSSVPRPSSPLSFCTKGDRKFLTITPPQPAEPVRASFGLAPEGQAALLGPENNQEACRTKSKITDAERDDRAVERTSDHKSEQGADQGGIGPNK
jgi:hypothetical protein